MPGIHIGLLGTPRHPVRLTGGFRSSIFDQTMPWPSIRSIGIALSRIVQRGTTIICGTSRTAGGHVAQYIKEDPRPLPKATQPMELDPQIRLIIPAGGIILFSGAQMHSSVPNTSGKTRFSIDLRV